MLRALSGLLGKIQRSREEAIAREYANKMRVVSSGIEQTAATLSVEISRRGIVRLTSWEWASG